MPAPRSEAVKPTIAQIEAFRREHHIPDDGKLETWAVEENMVLAYLCSLAQSATTSSSASVSSGNTSGSEREQPSPMAVAERCAEICVALLLESPPHGEAAEAFEDVISRIRAYAAALPTAPSGSERALLGAAVMLMLQSGDAGCVEFARGIPVEFKTLDGAPYASLPAAPKDAPKDHGEPK